MKLLCSCFTHISDYCFGFLRNVTREVSELQWKMDMGNISEGLDYCRVLWREGNVRLRHWKFWFYGEDTVFLLAMQGMFNHHLFISAFIILPPLTALRFFFFNLCHQNKLVKVCIVERNQTAAAILKNFLFLAQYSPFQYW